MNETTNRCRGGKKLKADSREIWSNHLNYRHAAERVRQQQSNHFNFKLILGMPQAFGLDLGVSKYELRDSPSLLVKAD